MQYKSSASIFIHSALIFTLIASSGHTLHAGNTGSAHAADDHNNRLNDALITASRAGDVDEINNLLEIGADINARDENGNTPLICATCAGCLSAMLVLIKNGARVDARNDDGDTALMLAAQYGQSGTIDLLVSSGSADVYLTDKNGDTAEVIADLQGQEDAFKLLVKLTAEMSLYERERNTNGQTKKRRIDPALSCGDEAFNFKGPNNDPDNNDNNAPAYFFF